MKTFVITVSRHFQTTHSRKGEPTFFLSKIAYGEKIHTIRGNYDLWAKRINEVKDGRAILSLRYWSDKPYRSKQKEFKRLDKSDSVGIQKLTFKPEYILTAKTLVTGIPSLAGYSSSINIEELAKNDGLSLQDFREWFKNHSFPEPMAIIHFTSFRY